MSESQTTKDLNKERSKATFDKTIITNILDGGPKKTARRKQLESLISKDPSNIFDNTNNPYLHRTERHVRALAKHVRLVELARKVGIGNEEGADGDVTRSDDWGLLVKAVADELPTSLHWVMFVPNILSLCDEEQKKEWLPMCRDWKMIGCYAQTELGHGSNVRGIETTATFLSESDGGGKGGSFVINSPTITSTKFWPGTLGRTANHAMVIARLIDGSGVDHGIHNFLVQLRSMDNHKLMPGVVTGDVGPKIGYNNVDNGFARFDHVVIPRRNMAMKFSEVDEHGKYRKKMALDDGGATEKVAYITMMRVRAYIINDAAASLASASTISIRYSALRRQGFQPNLGDEQPSSELQVLDYRQQQHRLFSMLASSYCFHFTGAAIISRLRSIEDKLSNSSSVTKTDISDLHASLSSLKSFVTTTAADGIEDCRKACGGHGFLQSSALPELATTYLVNNTVEGDNHMLPQQVLRVLLKLVKAIYTNDQKTLTQYSSCDSAYLIPTILSIMEAPHHQTCDATDADSIMNLQTLHSALRQRSGRLLLDVASNIQRQKKNEKSIKSSESDIMNDSQLLIARSSKAHALVILFDTFISQIELHTTSKQLGRNESKVLTDLAKLFALYWIEKDIGDFLEYKYFTQEQVGYIRLSVIAMLDEIRPNAVSLVDAWDFTDFRLRNSTLGRYDGDVYPAIMKMAECDPLNSTEPGPGYEEHLKPLIVDGVGRDFAHVGTVSRL